jgi:hypothetical protein
MIYASTTASLAVRLPASLAAYHSLSDVLRDTLFYFTDFQLIGPPFIIIT